MANSPTTSDYLSLIQSLPGGNGSRPSDYSVVTPVQTSSDSGLVAAAFKNDATGQIVVAFRGPIPGYSLTTGADGTLTSDGTIFANETPLAYIQAVQSFMSQVQTDAAHQGLAFNPANVYVTGSSLGGFAAQVEAQNGYGGASFGGPGLPGYTSTSGNGLNFTNYINAGDPVANFSSDTGVSWSTPNPLGDHYGNVVLIGNPELNVSLQSHVSEMSGSIGDPNAASQVLGTGNLILDVVNNHPLNTYQSILAGTPIVASIPDSVEDLYIAPIVFGDLSDGVSTPTYVSSDASGNITVSSPSGSVIFQAQVQSDSSGAVLSSYVASQNGVSISKDNWYNETSSSQFLGSKTQINSASGDESNESIYLGNGSNTPQSELTINFGSGAGLTTLTVEDASGDSQTATVNGAPVVQVGDGTMVAASGNGPSILVGGDNTSLAASNAQAVFVSLGNNVTLTGGGSGSTAVLDGTDQMASLSGATVNLGANATATINGSGDSISGGDGVGVTVNGSAATVNLGLDATVAEYGAGGSISTGGGSTVDVYGDDVAVSNNGSACTDGIHCVGDSVIGSDEIVSIDGSDSQVSVSGSGDNISAAAGSTLDLNGTSDAVNASGAEINVGAGSSSITVQGTGDGIQLGDYVVASVQGGGNYVTKTGLDDATTLSGSGNYLDQNSGSVTITNGTDSANLSNAYVKLGDGSTLTAYGSADVVTAGQGDTTSLNGNGNMLAQTGGTVTFTGVGNTGYLTDTALTLGNYTGVAVGGSGNTVTTGQYDNTQLYGNGNQLTQSTGTVVLSGSGENAAVTGAQVTLGAYTQATLSGSGNTVSTAIGDDLTANGGNNAISGGGDERITVGGTNGAADTITVSSDDNNVTAVDGQTAGIYVNGNAQADVNGSSDAISTTVGDTLNVDGGGSAITGGGNERIVLSNTYGAYDNVAVTGDDDNVNAFDGQTAGIYLTRNAQANLNGSADAVALNGTDILDAYGGAGNSILTDGGGNIINGASNDFVGVAKTYGVADTINGSGATVYLGESSQANIGGSGDSVTLNGNDVLGAYGGGNVVNSEGGSDTVNVVNTGGNQDTINGSGVNVNLNQYAQASTGGSDDIVTLNGNDVLGAYGGGNVVNSEAGSDTVNVANTGTNLDTINGSGVTVNLGVGDQANTGGSGDMITLNGSDILGAYGGSGNNISTTGGSNVINGANGSDRVSVSGDTNADSDTINASNDTGIVITSGSAANVSGNGNTITDQGGGDSLGVYGGSNTVNGATGSDVVFVGGNSNANPDTVNASYDSGLVLTSGAAANVNGSYDSVGLYGNDSLGVYSGVGNVINSYAAGDNVTIGSYTNADTVANDAGSTGPGVGVYIDPNSQATVSGFGNYVTATSGDTTYVSGNNDTATATANGSGSDTTTISGNNDVLTATGGTETISGSGDVGDINGGNVTLGGSTTTNIVGSGDTVTVGQSDTVGINGSYEDINVGLSDKTSIVGNYDIYNTTVDSGNPGSNDNLGITGSGEVVNALFNTISLGANTSISGAKNNYDVIYAVPGDNANLTNSYDDSAFGNNLSDFEIGGGSGNTLTGTGDGSDAEAGFSVDNTPFTGSDDPGDGTDGYDDPIILNLSGQSVQTQSVASSTAFFDMQNNGQQVQTGWLTAGEGVLVDDPSGAPVTQDSQLVGGFGALSTLAQTSDTTLDATNPLFDQLKVWIDPTGNAQFNPQDLHSLQDLGITSISLAPQSESLASNGNLIVADSTFTWKGGVTGDIAGVDLFCNPGSFAETVSAPAPSSAPDALTAAVNDLSATQAGASFSLLGDAHGTATTTTFDPSSLTAVPTTPANALLPVSHAA